MCFGGWPRYFETGCGGCGSALVVVRVLIHALPGTWGQRPCPPRSQRRVRGAAPICAVGHSERFDVDPSVSFPRFLAVVRRTAALDSLQFGEDIFSSGRFSSDTHLVARTSDAVFGLPCLGTAERHAELQRAEHRAVGPQSAELARPRDEHHQHRPPRERQPGLAGSLRTALARRFRATRSTAMHFRTLQAVCETFVGALRKCPALLARRLGSRPSSTPRCLLHPLPKWCHVYA